MNIEWIAGVPDANFKTGRDGNPVGLIVDHWMGTSNLAPGALFASAVSRFHSDRSIVSAHFLIGADGRVAQMVSTDDTAYHAGDWDTNLRAIGIEHEASPTLPPSDALYAASARLHAELARIYALPLEVGLTVKGHRDIVPTACPGTLDLDHIVALAGLEEDVALRDEFETFKRETIATIDAMKRTYNPLYHHVHLPGTDITPSVSSEALVPPVEGARYKGSSADLAEIAWHYGDGTDHTWVNGKEVA